MQDWAKNTLAGKLSKSDKLGIVDHSTINYPPFRRSFYSETGALAKMSEEEVAEYRKFMEDIKVTPLVPTPLRQSLFDCILSRPFCIFDALMALHTCKNVALTCIHASPVLLHNLHTRCKLKGLLYLSWRIPSPTRT